MRRWRAPGLESLFCYALVLFGFALGARPIADNSMLTHLRTGIDIAGGTGIPRADPYSYTAAGADWVVQSWLPSWSYGLAHSLGGFRLVVLEQAVLMGLLAWVIVRLARTGAPIPTAVAAGTAVGIGALYWSPRPLLFGLLCLAATVVVVDRRLGPWLLIPVAWLWVNSHGSFPLGVAWLVVRAAGEYLDWRSRPRETLRYLWTFLAGLVVAALNPLGVRLLSFPATVLDRSEVFADIIEWRSPNFQGTLGRFVLLFLVVVIVTLARSRVPWRDVLPVVAFLAAGLFSVRNVAAAGIVVAPVLGRALRPGPDAARPSGPGVARLNRVFLATIVAAFGLFGLSVLTVDPLRLDRFPVEAVTFLEDEGRLAEPHRLAHQDVVGNYLILRYGEDARVFVDDRYDMYPVQVSEDYGALLRAGPGVLGILDRYRVDTVLWADDRPLATVLALSREWDEVYRDDGWVVFERARALTGR